MTTATKPHRMLAAILLVLAAPGGWPQNVKVIANPSVQVDSISASELKSVFLQEKSSLAGSYVKPVLARGGPAHEAFLRLYLGKTDSDLQTYYRTLVFTGRGVMPKSLASEAEVVAYVARTSGAIGYVSTEISVPGVRTLTILGAAAHSDRDLLFRVEPDYPQILRSRSIGGTVRLRVTIAPSGIVKQVEVQGGDAVLGQAAATAVAKWKYTPARSETSTDVSITFDPRFGIR